jgi:hypothetical protein
VCSVTPFSCTVRPVLACLGCTLRAMQRRSERIAAAERALESDSEDEDDPETKARKLNQRLDRSGDKYCVKVEMVGGEHLQRQNPTPSPSSFFSLALCSQAQERCGVRINRACLRKPYYRLRALCAHRCPGENGQVSALRQPAADVHRQASKAGAATVPTGQVGLPSPLQWRSAPSGFLVVVESPNRSSFTSTWISGSDVNSFCCDGLVYLLDSLGVLENPNGRSSCSLRFRFPLIEPRHGGQCVNTATISFMCCCSQDHVWLGQQTCTPCCRYIVSLPLPPLSPPSLSPSYMPGSMQLMDRGPDGLNLVGTDAYEGSLLEDGPPGGVTVGPWTAVPMSVLRTLQARRAWRFCTVRCRC